MFRRRVGLSFVLLSILLSLGNIAITGAAVGSSISGFIPWISLVFLIVGFFLLISADKGLEIIISRKAIERAKNDRFISQNLEKYDAEIQKIAQRIKTNNFAIGHGSMEKMGEFLISPQGYSGSKGPRIAWSYRPAQKQLKIEDVLYHEKHNGKSNHYIDDWGHKVEMGDIRLSDYAASGYVPYKTPGQVEKLREKRKMQKIRAKEKARQLQPA